MAEMRRSSRSRTQTARTFNHSFAKCEDSPSHSAKKVARRCSGEKLEQFYSYISMACDFGTLVAEVRAEPKLEPVQ